MQRVLNQPPASFTSANAAVLLAPGAAARGAKEAAFKKQLWAEQNHSAKIGSDGVSEDTVAQVLADRAAAAAAYAEAQGEGPAVELAGFSRTVGETDKVMSRTSRTVAGDGSAADIPLGDVGPVATFMKRPEDGWHHRVEIIRRFVQAVRKVIIRQRADRKLPGLRLLVAGGSAAAIAGVVSASASRASSPARPDKLVKPSTVDPGKILAQEGKTAVQTGANEWMSKLLEGADRDVSSVWMATSENVLPVTFREYESPFIFGEKCSHEPIPDSELPLPDIKAEPYGLMQLVVPRQCDLHGYTNYRSSDFPVMPLMDEAERPLQRGTESTTEAAPPPLPGLSVPGPSSLGQLPPFPPNQIFAAIPGLQAHPKPFPYAEDDPDHWFNPYGLATAHPKTVARELAGDTVGTASLVPLSAVPEPGLTQSAVAIAAAPTLFNTWVPKLTDDLDAELFPCVTPPMIRSNADLPGYEPEEAESDDEAELEDAVPLTMDNVRSEFVIPASVSADTNHAEVHGEHRRGAAGLYTLREYGRGQHLDDVVGLKVSQVADSLTELPIRHGNVPHSLKGPVKHAEALAELGRVWDRATPTAVATAIAARSAALDAMAAGDAVDPGTPKQD